MKQGDRQKFSIPKKMAAFSVLRPHSFCKIQSQQFQMASTIAQPSSIHAPILSPTQLLRKKLWTAGCLCFWDPFSLLDPTLLCHWQSPTYRTTGKLPKTDGPVFIFVSGGKVDFFYRRIHPKIEILFINS
uniref:Uncharacterized protein n=1 Tax=Micrurus lemniscatus lemniscatus TaxID=129467 RepID=A0A2D4I235_MICLE